MGIVDLIILGVLLMVALIGWHQGLVRSALSLVGTIGGGCTEAEVWNAAREVMETEYLKAVWMVLS